MAKIDVNDYSNVYSIDVRSHLESSREEKEEAMDDYDEEGEAKSFRCQFYKTFYVFSYYRHFILFS